MRQRRPHLPRRRVGDLDRDARQIQSPLLDAGHLVIAAGGGGVPVVRQGDALVGVEAVIDKDLASALLGVRLGADRLVVLTDVDAVVRGFGTESSEAVPSLTAEEAEALLPELAEGSMRPKIRAAVDFVRATQGEVLITSDRALPEALAGRAGTLIAG